jgi:nitroreductase
MVDPSEWSEFVRSRRSVRDFRPDPVPDDVLRSVIGDALAAPSWSNTQPYRLAVASGERADRIRDGLARRIAEAAAPDGDFAIPLAYPEDLQERRRATGYGLYSVLGIDRSDRDARDRQMLRNFEFFGAPTALFAFVHEGLGAYSVLDAGFMLQTLLLSAHARGLSTCAQGALAVWAGPVRAEFDVPDHYRLICGVSLGYASDHPVNAFDPGRPSVDEVLIAPTDRC